MVFSKLYSRSSGGERSRSSSADSNASKSTTSSKSSSIFRRTRSRSKMAAPSHEQYILKVTAGSNYDTTKHTDVLINTTTPIKISTDDLDAEIFVRIRDYRGLPHGCPSNSPYFFTEEHKYDRYAISFSFTPKKNISGNDLVFGNDFDHPIRDRLPPGFSAAFRFVKWMIDPGLEGDVYADEPYLYGPVLSSMNIFRIGGKGKKIAMEKKEAAASEGEDAQKEDIEILHEGGDDDGEEIRNEQGIPADSAARKKHFLYENYRKDFEFEQGRTYACDFFNPYLDFNDLTLKLPVLTLPIVKHWDGQPLRSHSLRYVLKDKSRNEPLFVVIFSLVPVDESEDEDDVDDNDDDDASAKEKDGTDAKTTTSSQQTKQEDAKGAEDGNDDLD